MKNKLKISTLLVGIYIIVFQYTGYCLAPESKNVTNKKSIIISINTPGLVVHGVFLSDKLTGDEKIERLQLIFLHGLLPIKELVKHLGERIIRGLNPHMQRFNEDFVSLEMMHNTPSSYEETAAGRIYGAISSNPKYMNISIILNPKYVLSNANHNLFATGEAFKENHYLHECVLDKDGTVYNGFNYSAYGSPKSKFVTPLTFEVVLEHVPPEAFAAIVVQKKFANTLRDIVNEAMPDNSIQYFTPEGEELFQEKKTDAGIEPICGSI